MRHPRPVEWGTLGEAGKAPHPCSYASFLVRVAHVGFGSQELLEVGDEVPSEEEEKNAAQGGNVRGIDCTEGSTLGT